MACIDGVHLSAKLATIVIKKKITRCKLKKSKQIILKTSVGLCAVVTICDRGGVRVEKTIIRVREFDIL